MRWCVCNHDMMITASHMGTQRPRYNRTQSVPTGWLGNNSVQRLILVAAVMNAACSYVRQMTPTIPPDRQCAPLSTGFPTNSALLRKGEIRSWDLNNKWTKHERWMNNEQRTGWLGTGIYTTHQTGLAVCERKWRTLPQDPKAEWPKWISLNKQRYPNGPHSTPASHGKGTN